MAEERKAGSVVTSENLAEFNAQRLGLNDRVEAVVEETPAEPTSDDNPVSEKEATATEDRKQNPKLEKRFSEITKQREAARAEAQTERQRAESLEARLAELEKAQPKKAEVEPKPKPEQFTDAFEYAEALAEYKVDERIAEIKKQEADAKVAAERDQVINTWAKRVEAAKTSIPDFEDMVGSADVSVSNEVRDAIFESDVGPQVLYYLAENPEVALGLQKMTLTAALKQIGKLETKFEKTEAQTKPVVGKSKAPPPINPVRSAANGRDVNLTSNGEFHGSYQSWKAARMAGRIR